MNFLWTKHELISATNGSDASSNFLKNEEVVSGVSIDDRTIQKGDLFIAIKGDKFDGHDFIESAISKGASGAIVSEEQYARDEYRFVDHETQPAPNPQNQAH